MKWFHVYPINDLIEHNLEDYNSDYVCICNPTINIDDQTIIHDSLDRREVYE